MYTDGQIITKEEYKACANWINANGNQFEILSNGDGTYTVKAIIVPEPTNEDISKRRESLYRTLVDDLHLRRQRKQVCEEWTDADEANYVSEVKRLSKKIQDENPYIE